jgi:hypothetical protein
MMGEDSRAAFGEGKKRPREELEIEQYDKGREK